jgi:predicted metal-binding protein
MSAQDYLEQVRSLKCVVCGVMGMTQDSPTESHHIESVRDGLSDYATAAICKSHHTGPNGVHGLSRRAFEMRYKLSAVDLLALTIRQIQRTR